MLPTQSRPQAGRRGPGHERPQCCRGHGNSGPHVPLGRPLLARAGSGVDERTLALQKFPPLPPHIPPTQGQRASKEGRRGHRKYQAALSGKDGAFSIVVVGQFSYCWRSVVP